MTADDLLHGGWLVLRRGKRTVAGRTWASDGRARRLDDYVVTPVTLIRR